MEIKDIKYANLGRRVLGIILDLIFFIILLLFFYLPVVEGYIDIGFHNKQVLNDVKALQVYSGLFIDRSEEGQEPLNNVSLIGREELTDDNNYFTFDSYEVYLNATYNFYSNKELSFHNELMEMIFSKIDVNDRELNYWFNTNALNIDESEDFDVYYLQNGDLYSSPLNGNCQIKDTITFNGIEYKKNEGDNRNNQEYILASIKIFSDTLDFPGTYQEALLHLRNTSEYSSYYLSLERISRYEAYISIALSGTIYFLIIPLFFRNGETLGMKIVHIGLVNSLEYQVAKPQVFLKNLLILAEIFVGIFTFFLVFLVDYIVMIFTKRHRSFSDFVAATVMIDTKTSVWFVSRAVEDKLISQIEENLKKSNFLDEKNEEKCD